MLMNRRAAQRGLSLVELMVGITVGMIVVAGASLLMTTQVNEHRRLVLETQVQQDLRAVADLMLRDLRRAGFWATPQAGVWAPGAARPASNPYSAASAALSDDGDREILYSYSRASDYSTQVDVAPATPENNTLNSNESFGFRIHGNVLQSLLGGAWQPLTDPETLIVNGFSVELKQRALSLQDYCSTPCPAGSADCPPQQQIRRFDITISGQARHDARVQRTIRVSSRVRNDAISGACPPAPT
jgi:type IV pilus assembly protein PilW